MQKTFCSRNQRLVVVLFENCILNKNMYSRSNGRVLTETLFVCVYYRDRWKRSNAKSNVFQIEKRSNVLRIFQHWIIKLPNRNSPGEI